MIFISRPTLVLDKEKCLQNISKMVQKATDQIINFRPHFKTHQSIEVGNWFREFGVEKITVSSLTMAAYFIGTGWKSITVAFPLNIPEIDFLNQLAGKAEMHQTILSLDSLIRLEKLLTNPVHIWIKIDTGYRRTGIIWDNFDEIDRLAEFLKNSKKLKFEGFLAHAGHTYRARIKEEVEHIFEDSVTKLVSLRKRYKTIFPQLKISYGDTPSCSIIENLHDIDEIRPGNFVFYDIMQTIIGSCKEKQVAVALACPVVAKHKDRNTIVIYGGGVHLSKESIILHDGTEIFGKIALPQNNGWGETLDGCYVSSVSQEHGIITVNSRMFDKIKPGDILYILPVHSCLTSDLMQGYSLFDGTEIDHMSGIIKKSWR